MKLSLFLAAALMAPVGAVYASPLCIQGTMASYEALGTGGCTIGDKLFYNFGYSSTAQGNGVAVSDAAVILTPMGAGGTANAGFVFTTDSRLTPGWTVTGSANATEDSFVDSSLWFSVMTVGGAKTISAGALSMSGWGVSGTGQTDITETINPMGLRLGVDSNGPYSSMKNFAPTNSVSVLKDLFVQVLQEDPTGTAHITSFREDFQTPEPAGMALIGSGLLALGLIRRRRA